MSPNKRTAQIVGGLFLTSNVVFILGALLLIEPLLSTADYVTQLATRRNQLMLGVLLEILNGVAYLGIALLIYPILKQRFAGLALGYVGLRLVEFVLQLLADLSPLALLTLSEAGLASGAPAAASIEVLGTVLLAQRFWAFQLLSIVFGLGALLFYTMLMQVRLIPLFLSIWGLLGALVVITNTIFALLGINLPNLGVLMLLNEVFLGFWLIIRGFNLPGAQPQALASLPA